MADSRPSQQARGRSNGLSLFSCVLDEARKYNTGANTEEEQLVDRVLHESLKLKRKSKQLQQQVNDYEAQKNYAGLAYEKSLAEKDRACHEVVQRLVSDIEIERTQHSQESELLLNKEKEITHKLKLAEKLLAEKTITVKSLEENLRITLEKNVTLAKQDEDREEAYRIVCQKLLVAEESEKLLNERICAFDTTNKMQTSQLSKAEIDLRELQSSIADLLASKALVEKSARDVLLENETLRLKLKLVDTKADLQELGNKIQSPLRLTNSTLSFNSGFPDNYVIPINSPCASLKHSRPVNPNNGLMCSPGIRRDFSCNMSPLQ